MIFSPQSNRINNTVFDVLNDSMIEENISLPVLTIDWLYVLCRRRKNPPSVRNCGWHVQ